ncbi:hypothetical protein [Gemmatimonas groenlandica]|uniref:Uncharacterized protein n=1 Tax=Gemmatimonas groenlandica TaxID=2732249 RepID=A0A6M4IQH8_9BACT|nr:hypothetical protein [Gemmatimonas groenlandica]QJR37174.1 hypothetical protein HKW67_17450 [Gemmatimonas groenlandica]
MPAPETVCTLQKARKAERLIKSAASPRHTEEFAMSILIAAGSPLFARAILVGCLGGVGLVLGYRFSTRGPIILPIYAAILFVASLTFAQFPGISFPVRFSAVLLAMLVATAIAMAGVLYHAEQERRKRAERGLPPVECNRAPWWGAPFVFASVTAASAGVAALIR